MYDPIPNDNYNEWIELYNPTNHSINVSDWTISDNYAEDYLEGDFDHGNGTTIIPPYGYAIIADHGTKIYENFSISNDTIYLYVDDKSIGNGLGNSGDMLILKNNLNETIDTLEWVTNYSAVFGTPASSVEEGCSLSRHKGVDTNNSNNDFYEGLIPTPGYENRFIQRGKTEISCDTTSFLVKKHETLKIILTVKNSGDFFDNISLRIDSLSNGWDAVLEKTNFSLGSNESENVILYVTPCNNYGCITGNMSITAISEKEIAESGSITLFFEILGPDLWVKQIKVYDEEKMENSFFGQGEIVRIKAFLKNLGKENASDVNVCFYYDKIDEDCFIGCKQYDSVGKYQKYPSVLWDTQGVKPGRHTVIVVADKEDMIDELDEFNNELIFEVEIFDTMPSRGGRSIVFSEFYYHTHSGVYNEYFKVYNPSSEVVNISGWYFTNNPWKSKLDQKKLVFPNNTLLLPNDFLCIAQSADDYRWETGKYPDFEFYDDSDKEVPQMIMDERFTLSNTGGALSLKNSFNYTVDMVVYGENSFSGNSWNGVSIKESGEGVVLKRNFDESGFFVDTNSSSDWFQPIRYRIGQSCFPLVELFFNGEITAFVSPDSSYVTLVDEIRRANSSIFLNVYEFTHPGLCDALIDALLKGVSVCIFLEGSPIGGISVEETYLLKRIVNYGGNVRFIVSDVENKVYARYVFDHGKYLIVDNETVIVESCNWVSTGVPWDPSFGNREWGIIVRNNSVASYFLDVFFDDWNPLRCDSYSFENMELEIPEGFYMEETFYRGKYEPEFESMTFNGSFSVVPVFSPDNSFQAVCELIDSAKSSIYVEQLYIYKNWDEEVNPFVERLVNKSSQGVDVKVIMNYNQFYDSTNEQCNLTKQYLEELGVEVKFVFSNWSIFTNVHNKGVIVDNRSVLVSSINWNENSVTRNREAGIIVENVEVAEYYASVFFYDWNLNEPVPEKEDEIVVSADSVDYKNTIYIVVLYTLTFALIAQDWRKRKWT
jgi:phosphatidylserine/phosphatidylglycerophosphate/cardiolipin synthase-like enzyme